MKYTRNHFYTYLKPAWWISFGEYLRKMKEHRNDKFLEETYQLAQHYTTTK